MGISRAADLYYTYRFLKTLITPWKDMDAYKLGIIDENGKNLIKTKNLKTNDEKDSFTTFHRLVFNIKRMMEKIPFGKSRIASYAAALYLLREETGMSDAALIDVMQQLGVDTEITSSGPMDINENTQYILSNTINEDYPKGSIITIENTNPSNNFAGIPIYKTQENIYITLENIL
jgi:hypothetical protein